MHSYLQDAPRKMLVFHNDYRQRAAQRDTLWLNFMFCTCPGWILDPFAIDFFCIYRECTDKLAI